MILGFSTKICTVAVFLSGLQQKGYNGFHPVEFRHRLSKMGSSNQKLGSFKNRSHYITIKDKGDHVVLMKIVLKHRDEEKCHNYPDK